MEALVAIGLASNILGFVDFGRKLMTDTHKIYASQTVDIDADTIALSIQRLAGELLISLNAESKGPCEEDNTALKKLAAECVGISKQLLSLLESLKIKPGGPKWESLKVAFKAAWEKEELDKLKKRLDRMAQQLINELIPIYWRKIDNKLNLLIRENCQVEATRGEDLNVIRRDIDEIKNALSNNQGKDRKEIDKVGYHEIYIPVPTTTVERIVIKSDQYSAEQFILSQLRFNTIHYRQMNIQSAHELTYQWIFAKGTSCQYAEWFSEKTGIY
ncbi:hypothetical protein AA313_de0207439 [Arthrobotrys entomopaga]|nr:hypothetical protein AA313_de0207439 [Arthrobotrys entomopaga]